MNDLVSELNDQSWEIRSFGGDNYNVFNVLKGVSNLSEKERAEFVKVFKQRYLKSKLIYSKSESDQTRNYLVSGIMSDYEKMFSPLGSPMSFIRWKYVYKQILSNYPASCV
jgi:hypothetical protein